MKNIKIMFSAIAIVSVLGGALAFKAHSNNSGNIFTQGAGSSCNILDKTKKFSSTSTLTVTGTTVSTTDACPGTVTYVAVTD